MRILHPKCHDYARTDASGSLECGGGRNGRASRSATALHAACGASAVSGVRRKKSRSPSTHAPQRRVAPWRAPSSLPALDPIGSGWVRAFKAESVSAGGASMALGVGAQAVARHIHACLTPPAEPVRRASAHIAEQLARPPSLCRYRRLHVGLTRPRRSGRRTGGMTARCSPPWAFPRRKKRGRWWSGTSRPDMLDPSIAISSPAGRGCPCPAGRSTAGRSTSRPCSPVGCDAADHGPVRRHRAGLVDRRGGHAGVRWVTAQRQALSTAARLAAIQARLAIALHPNPLEPAPGSVSKWAGRRATSPPMGGTEAQRRDTLPG